METFFFVIAILVFFIWLSWDDDSWDTFFDLFEILLKKPKKNPQNKVISLFSRIRFCVAVGLSLFLIVYISFSYYEYSHSDQKKHHQEKNLKDTKQEILKKLGEKIQDSDTKDDTKNEDKKSLKEFWKKKTSE